MSMNEKCSLMIGSTSVLVLTQEARYNFMAGGLGVTVLSSGSVVVVDGTTFRLGSLGMTIDGKEARLGGKGALPVGPTTVILPTEVSGTATERDPEAKAFEGSGSHDKVSCSESMRLHVVFATLLIQIGMNM